MENLERILSAHPFLSGMTAQQIEVLVGCASNAVFKPGEFIIREGQPADHFYFIRHGLVQIETHIPQRGALIIRTRHEGEVLGWSWMIPPYRWHFDARVSELTRVIAMDGKCLRDKCDHDHDLGYEIMKRFSLIIAERLEATRLQLMDVYGNSTTK
ncbi:MAG: cyclic nucleotide-binding domain-containing protein [candidate division Zixibacteria bacterium]|nr:cyclic nucleotide-binding domain-containing protein [candidate division Zixibacteria bacterium]